MMKRHLCLCPSVHPSVHPSIYLFWWGASPSVFFPFSFPHLQHLFFGFSSHLFRASQSSWITNSVRARTLLLVTETLLVPTLLSFFFLFCVLFLCIQNNVMGRTKWTEEEGGRKKKSEWEGSREEEAGRGRRQVVQRSPQANWKW